MAIMTFDGAISQRTVGGIAVPAGGAGGAIAPQVSKIWAKLRFFGQ